ncbi:MAG: acyl-CoA dehydrogenase [Rhodospirillaceae bacterium]|jgi:acyl-CoA dehydrogenase|nr:acyl-CoA dehydrogenase [Rhodospirillaceae bacterium]MBT7757993.1 acyl-CoA dehydrogenase [Rhodospirillaceae bacterium]
MSTLRHPIYDEDSQFLREQIRRFCDHEIEPHGEAWEAAGRFPKELYEKAGEAGLLGLGFPEEYGGTGGDILYYCLVREEIAYTGFAGVRVGLFAHGIGLPPVINLGSEAMKQRIAPQVLSGEKIICLAISEPEAGSDVAQLRTTARRDGGHFVVNGQKMFISNGIRADYATVAVRTGGEGMAGLSLLLVEGDTPGFSRTPLQKSGWWTSDTAALYFDDCRVPVENLIGEENAGFKGMMANFNLERLGIAATQVGITRCCYHEALAYAQQRKTFGQHLIEHQVVRHKLVDMSTRIQAMEGMLDNAIWQVMQGNPSITEIAQLKAFAGVAHEACAADAVQIMGGAGIIRGSKIERIFRESKILSIGGGSAEVMKDLAARQMKY